MTAPTPSRRLWVVRMLARAPRVLAVTASAVLMAVGLRSLVAVAPVPAPSGATALRSARFDVEAAAFAESFARTYLSWDVKKRDDRERRLARFGQAAATAAFDITGSKQQVTRWSTVVADRRAGPNTRIVTVAVETTSATAHVAVTVRRDDRGFLFVASPPAIVGAPPVAMTAQQRPEDEVDDAELRGVAARVVKNYLAREREDLAADLDPRAIVSLPELPLRVASVDGVTWVDERRRRVAVAVTAAGRDGLRLALRYELAVTRRAGRWLVRTVHVNPAAREAAS